MKPMKYSRAKYCLALAAGLSSFQACATIGPYVGLQFGLNIPGSEKFGFRGQHTTLPQSPIPTELPLIQNFGEAGKYKYDKSVLGQFVIGDELSFGLRPEFELSLRRDEPSRITYSNGDRGATKGVRLSSTSGLLNFWYDFFPHGKIHPYLGAGAGFVRVFLNNGQFNPPAGNAFTAPDSRKADDQTAAFQGGAGVNWDVLKHVTVGLDYRYFRTLRVDLYPYKDQPETFVSGSYKAQSVLLSVHYHFAIPTPPAAAPEPPPAVVPVEAPPPPPPPPPCEMPAAGEAINLAGCKTGDTLILRGVNFDFNKATLTANAKTLLDQVSDALTARPDIKVELDGHTDSIGSDAYNQKLSERRAASVKAYLVDKGIAADRMSTKGFGESMPVADNKTKEGRDLNRRVELKVLESGGSTDVPVSSGATDSTTPTTPASPPPADASPPPAEGGSSDGAVSAPTDAPSQP